MFYIEYGPGGWFRIVEETTDRDGKVTNRNVSEWAGYQGIAQLRVDGKTYIAVSDYHAGGASSVSMQPNQVYSLGFEPTASKIRTNVA